MYRQNDKTSDLKILARLLYKNKSQRRMRHFYLLKRVVKIPSNSPIYNKTLLLAYNELQNMIHEALYVPFCLACLAIVARLYHLNKNNG